ncbi:NAD(P)-dependent oxidoreductase [Marmoricola sp. URHB0036]|uniref:NAD(P)-dependent oxidoreductase n=1 Tax=Marmoricola sp. URHB0036 TaxID=1298863 RepID=UPI000412A1DE|nr:NAD(P)-dependent oxidoreductase [Marmoricola sp. URHB0036]
MTEAAGARTRTVGVVGLGAMGLPIANALTTRRPVLVYDAVPAASSRAAAVGLPVAGSLTELAQSCNTVLLSLPSAAAVEEVVAEIAPNAPGLLILDTSTIGPEDSRRIGALALADGSTYLDTPILGRPDMVGSWTIPVGGPVAAHAAVADVLAPIAQRVVHVGDLGAAATLKVANNLMFSVINAVTAEALLLAQAAGLDPGVFVDTVMDSGAATVSGLFRSIAPRAVDGEFAPTFSIELVRKDNDLAVQLATSLGLELAVGSAARDLHDRAVLAGHGAEDSVAVLRLLEEEYGQEARRH